MANATASDRFRRVPSSAGFCEPSKLPKGPNGRALCRQCSTEVKPPKITFCSKGCVEAWKLRNDVGLQRRAVFKRDGGLCRACRLDVKALEERVAKLVSRLRDVAWDYEKKGRRVAAYRRLDLVGQIVARMGFRADRSFWEMDHIRPVVMGGGSCGLDNLRVLCVPCHKLVTAELARRRAARRRAESERTEKGD